MRKTHVPLILFFYAVVIIVITAKITYSLQDTFAIFYFSKIKILERYTNGNDNIEA
jgi:hypothetical protein